MSSPAIAAMTSAGGEPGPFSSKLPIKHPRSLQSCTIRPSADALPK